ncbi:hypothetical protein M8J75_010771 [Diaphorina citri]|nr:hypothetical protein M8J75_010771 [Diaphorina citri]
MVIQLGLGIQATQAIFDPPRVVLDSKQHQNLSFKATPLKFTTQRAVSEGNSCKSQIQPSRLKCSHLLWRFWNPTNCLSLKANPSVFQEIVPGKSKFCLVGTMRFVSLCQQLMYYGYLYVSDLRALAIFFGSAGKIGIPPCPNHAILCRVSATYSGLSGSAGDLLVC